MNDERKGNNLARLAIGAGILAVAAVGVAAFVPRRKLDAIAGPLRGLLDSPVALAMAAWATGLWAEMTAPRAPQFDDLRPFDEF